MVDLLVWLFSIELIGLAAFPIAFLLFHHLPDRGFSLVKPLTLVAGSYALWVLGLTHLVLISGPRSSLYSASSQSVGCTQRGPNGSA